MTERPLSAAILAAGAGTRMKSNRPKPLHVLCGRPMVVHVLDSLSAVDIDWAVLVVGHEAEKVIKTLNESAPAHLPLHFVEQTVQRGTGDAVSIALSSLPSEVSDDAEDADILVLPGDTPLLEAETVARLVAQHRESGAAATILTVTAPDPTGYGRVVRDKHGRVRRIVEERDATEEERLIDEVNTSVYCFKTSMLGVSLRRINSSNDQNELYVTDVIEILTDAGHQVETLVAPDVAWAVGVNDRVQLAQAEAELRKRINEKWMMAGVSMVDPTHTYVDVDVRLAADVCLLPNTRLSGKTRVDEGSEIGPDTHLADCVVGPNAVVSKTEGSLATIGAGAKVGPYVVLEPGTEVAPGAVVGPFFRSTEPFGVSHHEGES